MAGKQSIGRFRLDPALFNQDFYLRILRQQLSSWPTAHVLPDKTDLRDWFGVGASPEERQAFDKECSALSSPALSSIGPSKLTLPPFESHEADRKLHSTLAAPFLPEFVDEDTKSAIRDREDAAYGLVLLLDQMTRVCFRGDDSRVVFEHYDRIARAVASAACETGYDRASRWNEAICWRQFFYMPLIHSESIADHELLDEKRLKMLELAQKTGNAEAVDFIEQMRSNTAHIDALKKFGRFPWRNAALGRKNTKEEQEFLDNGGGPFTQPKKT